MISSSLRVCPYHYIFLLFVKNSNAKLIYRAHNIENMIWQRLARQKSDPFKKSYLRMHARRIKNYELQQLNSFNGIAVFTEQDKGYFLEYGINIPIDVCAVGINLQHYQPDISKTRVSYAVLFRVIRLAA